MSVCLFIQILEYTACFLQLKKLMTSEEDDYKSVLRAVESGDNSAKTKLAWFKLSGHGGASLDTKGAVKLLEERVEEGDTEAMWMLGVCYEYKIGTEQDSERAVKLYRQSCDGGNEIGEIVAKGNGSETGFLGMERLRTKRVSFVRYFKC